VTAAVVDILDFDNLLPELALGLGLALLLGNGFAWWKHHRGEAPNQVEHAEYRAGRVGFLSLVGLLMTIWAVASLFN
jgi:hypothetical protein